MIGMAGVALVCASRFRFLAPHSEMTDIPRPSFVTPLRAVWSGVALQSISEEVFRLAVVWMAIALVGSSASALPAIQYFCAFVIGMVAGAIADRFAPRTTLAGANLLRAAFVVMPLLTAGILGPSFPILVAAAVGVSGLSAFFQPALHASVPRLAGDATRMQAVNGMFDATTRLSRLVGPFLGGFLALVMPVEHFLLVAAGGMVLSALAISCAGPSLATPFERPASETPDTLLSRLGRGMAIVRRDAVINRLLLVNVATIGLWTLALTLGLAMLIERRPPQGFEDRPLVALSLVLGIYGVGDIISNLLVSRARPRDRWAFMFSGYVIMGAGIFAVPLPLLLDLGRAELPLMMLFSACTGLGGPRYFLLMLTLVQTRLAGTDLTALLRLRMALMAAAMCTGALSGLALFPLIGPLWTVALCGLGIFLLAVIGWWARPAEMRV